MIAFTKRETSSGFSIVEVGLVVVVVAIISVLGYLFYQNNIAKQSSKTPSTVAPAGTTASIDQLTQQAATAESSVDSNADSQAVDNATSASGAIGNVGGAYDENGL